MASSNSVVIFGASGNVGQYVVPALLKAGVKVTVVTRKGSNTAFSYENATVATTDYRSQSELVSIIRGHASVISILSAGALSLQRDLIDAAIEAGATLFIPSEFGHDTTNEDVTSLLPILSVKSGITTYLQEREKDGLSWIGIITALFFDWVGYDFLPHNFLA
jgi:NAD(P)-dependent dehydrogenase (short-subunit alcohol dehydrogenase family)